MINCKIELKLRWTNHCVLSAAGSDNDDANPNNIIFTIKDTKWYVPVVTLSADDYAKRYKAKRYYLPKVITKNFNVIINRKNFHNQPTDSDTKWYEEIRKLTTGQDYTTGCLLHYEYIKNYYRLIAVHLSRRKGLDASQKSMQQIELIGKFKKNLIAMVMLQTQVLNIMCLL